MKTFLGCIADDLTGATDLANNLVRAGMRVVQIIGVPEDAATVEAEAIVVALKSRTIPAAEAAAQSIEACRWLRTRGAQQIYFKVCSTFDSSLRGNIGPVIEALMTELGCDFSVVTPAFPEARRTVFNGHLFVDGVLLSETGMRNHPLTPMKDANLVRVLQKQLDPDSGRKVGLIDFRTVAESSDAIWQQMDRLREDGISIAIVDAINNDDLMRLAAAVKGAALVTAASGLAIGLPGNWGIGTAASSCGLPRVAGRKAIVAGSCSNATIAQVRHFIESGGEACQLKPEDLNADFDSQIVKTLDWAETRWATDRDVPLLLYSTAEAASVRAAQELVGAQKVGALIEHALSAIARGLVELGAGQLILAGGETAGACIHALDIRQLQIGPQIDPGVPWCYAGSPVSRSGNLHVALKSGNFGSQDFFTRAFTLID
jgi:uncharacterized protein YgbK (DUF1537 family)